MMNLPVVTKWIAVIVLYFRDHLIKKRSDHFCFYIAKRPPFGSRFVAHQ